MITLMQPHPPSPRLLTLQCPWPLLQQALPAGCRILDAYISLLGCSLGKPWGAFGCPTRAAVVWCTRQSEGVWAGQKKQGSHSTSVLGSSALQKGWSVFKWHCSRNRLWQADEPIPVRPSLPWPATCRDQSTEWECTGGAFNLEWGQGYG